MKGQRGEEEKRLWWCKWNILEFHFWERLIYLLDSKKVKAASSKKQKNLLSGQPMVLQKSIFFALVYIKHTQEQTSADAKLAFWTVILNNCWKIFPSWPISKVTLKVLKKELGIALLQLPLFRRIKCCYKKTMHLLDLMKNPYSTASRFLLLSRTLNCYCYRRQQTF